MIKIYRDEEANAIFIENANGAQFLNSLQATVPSSGLVTLLDLARGIDVVSDTSHTQFIKEDGIAYSGTAIDVCNTLNAIFQTSGSSQGLAPTITSSLAISLTEGDSLNYELTADYGVGYEWDLSSVSGVTTVEGNTRKLVGGSSLAAGTYNIPVKAVNYNGEDSETLVLTVSTPPFANTKSVQFNTQDYLGANAALLDPTLGRTANGSGASDAWSISFWIKPTHTQSGRVLFYYGSNDTTNGGIIEIRMTSSNKLRLQYGSANNCIRLMSPNALTNNVWQHITYTYDGGTTGASSGSINNYYSRFNLFIDGVSQSTSNSNINFGWSGALSGQNLRVGKLVSGNTLAGEKVDELAIWGSDQSANISDIYNSGTPFDLSTLGTGPDHWWRMGDGDTYPTIQDNVGTAHFTMYNMTVADIVTDVP